MSIKVRRIIIGFSTVLVVCLVALGAFIYGTSQQGATMNTSSKSNSATDISNGSGTTTQSAPTDIPNNPKILTVYFSRTKGVYNGLLKIGNTKRIADDITRIAGGNQFEIIPQKNYPDDYRTTTEVASQEQRDNARPALKNPAPDISQYDVIFLGAPVWWGEYPMVVRTFMDAVDLNGKTVIPFSTHEGSGLGAFASQIQKQWPEANVPEGLAVRGSNAANAQGDVQAWLEGLDLAQ